MSDQTGSAASLLAGNPPADSTTSNPPAGGAPPAAPPAPPAGGSWFDSIQDDETKTWAQGKGWKEPTDILASYKNLEKLLGGEKIPVPKDANDTEGWDRLFKAAGRPDAPDAYGLEKIEGADPAVAKAAADAMHKAGLNPRQAATLAEFWNGSMKGQAEAMQAAQAAEDQAFIEQSQVEMGTLRQEWGGNFDANVEAARRATMLAGLDGEAAGKIERAIGSKAMMQLFAKFGTALSESTFRTGNNGGGSGFMTPAIASERKAGLLKDPGFISRLRSRDPAASAELDRLQKIAAGISA